jgi:SAM-dependent methyltransferase
LPACSFDAVTMSHVIEHVYDPESLLRTALGLLKPNGTLVCVTPNVLSDNHLQFGRSWRDLDPPRHLQLFTPDALENLARHAGFRSVTIASSLRPNRSTEIASRNLLRDGRYDWSSPGTYSDRVIGTYHLWRAIVRRRDRQLRGDELVLHAKL